MLLCVTFSKTGITLFYDTRRAFPCEQRSYAWGLTRSKTGSGFDPRQNGLKRVAPLNAEAK